MEEIPPDSLTERIQYIEPVEYSDGAEMANDTFDLSEMLSKLNAPEERLMDTSFITLIRNTLRQYYPKQFFTEFIANASDAGATRFSILIDHHEASTECLLSKDLAKFQNASLVVHNDGTFSQSDFRGMLETGVGGKRGRTGVIGHFGLGALSMFHFTEVRSSMANLPKTNFRT